MSTIDLTALPAPQVLEDLDYEVVYQGELAAFREFMGDNWTALLESDPVTKLIELGAYRRLQNRARVNDGAKAVLLAYAKGSDLDHLVANVRLQRLVVQAADLQAVPPVPAVLEEDDALRERVQLVYEGLTTAGPRNSYILHARNSSGRVADATAESPAPAEVVVTVLALEGNGEPFGYLIEVVEWWELVPHGVPGTFALKVGVSDEGISDETYQELTWLIDDARPVSRHMVGLEIGVETKGTFYLGIAHIDGDTLNIYPPQQLDIDVTGQIGRGGRDHTIDNLDIAHG